MVVEVETDPAVEVGIAEIELEWLVEEKGQSEEGLPPGLQTMQNHTPFPDCLDTQSCPFAHILLILEAEVRELDILRGVVFDLEETLTLEEPELLLVVLAGQVQGNDLVTVVNPLGKQLA